METIKTNYPEEKFSFERMNKITWELTKPRLLQAGDFKTVRSSRSLDSLSGFWVGRGGSVCSEGFPADCNTYSPS